MAVFVVFVVGQALYLGKYLKSDDEPAPAKKANES